MEQRYKAPALRRFAWGKTCKLENGGTQIDVQRHRALPFPPMLRRNARIVNDQRNPDGLFMGVPFPGEPMLSIENPVVGRVNDDGILCKTQPLQVGTYG